MLYLNKEDILSIANFSQVMDEIEKAYKVFNSGDFYMPDRTHVICGNKTLLYMPCFLPNIFGTKILTVFPDNAKLKKPAIYGLMLLNDYETGKPSAILDGRILTSLRTGAVGGLSIRHLTPNNVKSVGVIGAGAQGFYQVLYACAERDIQKIYLFDPYSSTISEFVKTLKERLSKVPEIIVCSSSEELVSNCDIVITTTTSKEPVIPNDPDLLKGRHFVGVGSYKINMREYPDAIFSVVKNVYVDLEFAKEESGDLAIPLTNGLLQDGQVISFDRFLLYEKDKKAVASGTTFFKTVGMALFDLVVADYIFEKAKKEGKGQELML